MKTLSLQKKFNDLVAENNWWQAKDRVIIALSGGVDSMTLLYLLHHLPHHLRPQIVIAHVNHHLREASNQEENFIRQLAKNEHLPLQVYHWLPENHPSSGTEVAAREMRYSFFRSVMKDFKAHCLLTAHHADDQAETILMRLVRGSSLNALSGIQLSQPFAGGELIRPLLSLFKDDLYNFAHEKKIVYFEDETNAENDFTRNRYRNVIIPQLESENKQVKNHLIQFSQQMDDLIQISDELTEPIKRKLWHEDTQMIKLDLIEWRQLSKALQRYLITDLLYFLTKKWEVPPRISYQSILLNWMNKGKVNSHLELAGSVLAVKNYQHIIFKKEEKYLPEEIKHWELNIGESVKISNCERISLISSSDLDSVNEDKNLEIICFKPDDFQLPLTIRHRQAGDKMRVKGLQGRKKIKDILIDEKISRKKRDKLWIIADKTGKIMWLIDIRHAERTLKLDDFSTCGADDLLLIYEKNS